MDFNTIKKHWKKEFSEDGVALSDFMGGYGAYLLALVTIAGLAVMAFALVNSTNMQQALSSMVVNIKTIYGTAPSYSGLTNAVAIKAGGVPRNFLKGKAIKAPGGGNITLAPSTDGSSFTIRVEKVKQEECIKLASHQQGFYESITINQKKFDVTGESATTAINACGKTNTMIFTAR